MDVRTLAAPTARPPLPAATAEGRETARGDRRRTQRRATAFVRAGRPSAAARGLGTADVGCCRASSTAKQHPAPPRVPAQLPAFWARCRRADEARTLGGRSEPTGYRSAGVWWATSSAMPTRAANRERPTRDAGSRAGSIGQGERPLRHRPSQAPPLSASTLHHPRRAEVPGALADGCCARQRVEIALPVEGRCRSHAARYISPAVASPSSKSLPQPRPLVPGYPEPRKRPPTLNA